MNTPSTNAVVRITDQTGDTRMPFHTDDAAAVEAVKIQFDRYMDKGYAAFKNGLKLKAFDPAPGETTMIGPIVSG